MKNLFKRVKIVKKGSDDENLKYYLGLSYVERLKHLEKLRTDYIKWKNTNDPKSRLQRVYTITKRA